ncbi:fimbria/pilus periplasmic chaperone [Enterovibrio baiacu]|uniref:fimbria/pilus periplasmic chaperone n=1 Tax=Enterovibrio baiacu TaxID=2491023 RepID=UPI00101119C3|nr:fimbria/pilus periplasmic chaperone [Enterovibrio baiacu]MBE1277400.1 molecular chaperone [Enterovibrio baiacu]
MRVFRSLLIALLLFSPITKAFELLPMVSFFSDHGSKSEQFFQVHNTTGLPLPLEIFVKQRAIAENDSETLIDSEDFFVFPPQALIPPGKTQMVKVKYIGDLIDASTSYRIIFSQLPIQDEEKKSSIKMLFQIGALAFVTPDHVENLVEADVSLKGNAAPELLLENKGTGVVVISDLSFNVKADDTSYTWQWEDIKDLVDRQFLVPGESTRMSVETLLTKKHDSLSVDVKGDE